MALKWPSMCWCAVKKLLTHSHSLSIIPYISLRREGWDSTQQPVRPTHEKWHTVVCLRLTMNEGREGKGGGVITRNRLLSVLSIVWVNDPPRHTRQSRGQRGCSENSCIRDRDQFVGHSQRDLMRWKSISMLDRLYHEQKPVHWICNYNRPTQS